MHSMYVCIYVYIYLCINVCIYVYIYLCINVCMYIYLNVQVPIERARTRNNMLEQCSDTYIGQIHVNI